MVSYPRTVLEGLGVALAGAGLGWSAGAWVAPWLGVAMAVVGGVNGLVSGIRRIYPWRTAKGWLAFVLDSTWASLPVASGLLAHLVAAVTRGEFLPAMSTREGHHVYRRGAAFKRGYALTLGNVISGAADVERPRRAQLVRDHEGVHVWQARWFGPLYLPLYGLWAALGAGAGLVMWPVRRRREPLGHVVETCAYYLNPFEWWAYSRDAYWPPHGKIADLGWRKPVCRSFAELREPPTRLVQLHPYDPAWPAMFELERGFIVAALGAVAVEVHHTGSTSVPGLAAKPIIDITLGVADIEDEDAYLPQLEAAGYTFVMREPEWFAHRLFQRQPRVVNLHVFETGCSEIAQMTGFRDWLRAHPDDRDLYERTKRSLSEQEWERVQDYADAKTDVVMDIKRRAGLVA